MFLLNSNSLIFYHSDSDPLRKASTDVPILASESNINQLASLNFSWLQSPHVLSGRPWVK